MMKKWNKYNNKLKMFYNHKLIIFLNKTKKWIRTSNRLKMIRNTQTPKKMKREPLVKINKIQNIQMTKLIIGLNQTKNNNPYFRLIELNNIMTFRKMRIPQSIRNINRNKKLRVRIQHIFLNKKVVHKEKTSFFLKQKKKIKRNFKIKINLIVAYHKMLKNIVLQKVTIIMIWDMGINIRIIFLRRTKMSYKNKENKK